MCRVFGYFSISQRGKFKICTGNFKAKLICYIPLETAANFFFISELLSKTGYWLGVCHVLYNLHGLTRAARSENGELQNEKSCPQRDLNSRSLNHKSSAVSNRHSNLIYYRQS